MNPEKVALLEAILFTTTEPLSLDDLQKIIKGRRDEIEKALASLRERYAAADYGIRLSDIGGYRLIVKNEYVKYVADLTPHADMSRGLLRVLSIIAYHEPIKQSDIVKVIGNRTYDYVHELVDRGFVQVEKKSRTRILSTTPRFEEYFETKKEELKKMMNDTMKGEEAENKDKGRQSASS